jgi:hypothetical protein
VQGMPFNSAFAGLVPICAEAPGSYARVDS